MRKLTMRHSSILLKMKMRMRVQLMYVNIFLSSNYIISYRKKKTITVSAQLTWSVSL